jgi:hypothetical protein
MLAIIFPLFSDFTEILSYLNIIGKCEFHVYHSGKMMPHSLPLSYKEISP